MGTLLESNEPDLTLVNRGKVRDVYRLADGDLLIVATDRISAFDFVLPTPIPGKGQVLTQLSNFWFDRTAGIIPNHLVDRDPYAGDPARAHLRGRSVVVRSARSLPVEAIVRGYLAGSGLKEYRAQGTVCGIPLPEGLVESSKLPEPIYTPSTKAAAGTHDENIPYEQTIDLLGEEVAAKVRDASLALYGFAAGYARERGVIIADTKFEFGLFEGELIFIDEALTPDSSRFWPADAYSPGTAQPSYDKQFVRDYLESIGWDKQPPVPDLPLDIVEKTAQKYHEALRRLTA
jgi:phosphoribosylaminoimidazole-succinocarboxamide synthase